MQYPNGEPEMNPLDPMRRGLEISIPEPSASRITLKNTWTTSGSKYVPLPEPERARSPLFAPRAATLRRG